jgi:hypothetical protein
MPNRIHFPNVLFVKSISGASHWLTKKFTGHHQNALDLQIKHLRELDHHMLWDMGIDRAALYDRSPKIEKFHFDVELSEEDESKH